MAARRERVIKGRNGQRRLRAAGTLPGAEPEGDFLPPGFSLKKIDPEDDRKRTTYFLYTEKRSIQRYVALGVKHFQRGFRAVIVTESRIVFDRPSARVAGRVQGDRFDEGVEWVKRDVLEEHHGVYVKTAGGSAREKKRATHRYFRALGKREEFERKRYQLEEEIDAASVDMVHRHGKNPYVIREEEARLSGLPEGRTLDACRGPGDKVYWRIRGGK